jgi:uncharacterized protein (TIGR00730 family)
MNVCVFCGSSSGSNPVYADAAESLGKLMAGKSMKLIYGGGNVGLMGILANSVMKHNGEVIGVIPQFLLDREVGHRGITKLEIVESMHQRKKRMADIAEAFIALPGGWGTLEEIAEVLTWRQLSLIPHPVGLLNINSFFDPLIEQMAVMARQGFLNPEYLKVLHVERSAERLLNVISGDADKPV